MPNASDLVERVPATLNAQDQAAGWRVTQGASTCETAQRKVTPRAAVEHPAAG
jgi:hypothetical protein